MDSTFLDANILFSAAYRPDAHLRRLWQLPQVELLTSTYAAEEARRNLASPEQRTALNALLVPMRIVAFSGRLDHPVFTRVMLPNKDRPILLAAINARATHLLTGDFQHFGPYYGQTIEGVLILPPGAYIRATAREIDG